MNIPVTPYFFRKLEIYERIEHGDRLTTKRKSWIGEKILLKWSVREKALHNILTADTATSIIIDELKGSNLREYQIIKQVATIERLMGNLIQRELAKKVRNPNYNRKTGENKYALRFTEEGRLWGDVLLDIENGNKYKYTIPSSIIKVTALTFIIAVLLKSADDIALVLYKLIDQASHW